jgi:hypothetical protein
MKKDYWNVEDAQVIEKTGKTIAEWITILDEYKAAEKKIERSSSLFTTNL